MIKFPCKCGHVISLPEDQAGGLTQCPRCNLLVDVPTLGDLANLNDDGTLRLHDAPAHSRAHSAQALAEMHTAFTPHTTDSHGIQKDLRLDAEHFRRIGDPPPHEDAAAVYARTGRTTPKYDPVTGELIRPIKLKDDPAPLPVVPVVPLTEIAEPAADELVSIPVQQTEPIPQPIRTSQPVPRPRSISYAARDTRSRVGVGPLAIELFMPANSVVMFFAFLAYIAAGFTTWLLWVGSNFTGVSLQILNIPLWIILAHYGTVIEDTGPDERDELPRPLRNLALGEDIFTPALWWAMAGVICYWPTILVALPGVPIDHQTRLTLVAALGLAGSAMLPAVLLTTIAGSTSANLRPDRVLAVIYHCGIEYIISVGVFLLAVLSAALILVPPPAIPALVNNKVLVHTRDPYIAMPILTLSVYLGHYFAWHLGLLYREHHNSFPWAYQRHIPTRRH